jgi:hypothetical protein
MALKSPAGVEATIQPAKSEQVTSIDGTLVADAGRSTQMVTIPTAQGAQFVAILDDRSASPRIPFDLLLPEEAEIVAQPDGSLIVDAPSSRTLPKETVTEMAPIAMIEAPWAVDAAGTQLRTHFEVTSDGIVQVVDTDETTQFPITADPNWLWWAWTTAQCAANVATVIAAFFKLASKIAKIQKYIDASARLAALVSNLGGVYGMLVKIGDAARGIAAGSIYKYLSRDSVLALGALVSSGMGFISEVLGIGSCYSLLQEAL